MTCNRHHKSAAAVCRLPRRPAQDSWAVAPRGAGAGTHPSAQALVQMLKVSGCMPRRGISDFADPVTSVPSGMAGVPYLSDRDAVIPVFPRGFDDQSPAFTRAAAACLVQLTNH